MTIDQTAGANVSVVVLPDSRLRLARFCGERGVIIEPPVLENLHCTLLYHRGDCSGLQLHPEDHHSAHALQWTLFHNYETGRNDVLVLTLRCPSVVDRHEELHRRHNATWDFLPYRPHITVAHRFAGDLESLDLPDFGIELGAERVKPIWMQKR